MYVSILSTASLDTYLMLSRGILKREDIVIEDFLWMLDTIGWMVGRRRTCIPILADKPPIYRFLEGYRNCLYKLPIFTAIYSVRHPGRDGRREGCFDLSCLGGHWMSVGSWFGFGGRPNLDKAHTKNAILYEIP